MAHVVEESRTVDLGFQKVQGPFMQELSTLTILADRLLRLQDTLFGVLWKIATARSKSVRFSSNFHQMLASAWKI